MALMTLDDWRLKVKDWKGTVDAIWCNVRELHALIERCARAEARLAELEHQLREKGAAAGNG